MTYPRSQTPDGVNAEMLDALHQLQIENQNLRNTLHAAVRISEGQRSEPPKLGITGEVCRKQGVVPRVRQLAICSF
ncbi:hypothetical protein MP228_013127 [Amoeboaphelidium protococcarum]|nr:hypothetical protein MP228_013127 [Amoeboaphelidium protococcarum]